MKKSLSFLIVFLLSLTTFAQPPQRMSYQCVVRDHTGALVTDHLVGMRTTIYQGSLPQLVVYQETYNFTATNTNGLLTVEIGSGNPTIVSRPFTSIPWSSGPFFLQTEIDPTGGTNYTIVGKSQILSVPYALYAEEAGTVVNSDAVTLSGNQTITGTKTFAGLLFTNEILYAKKGIHNGMYHITNVAIPIESHHAATKGYVDSYVDDYVDNKVQIYLNDSVKTYVIELFKTMGLIPVYYAGTVTDIDGNIYTTVTIADQIWMAQNLRVTHYRDGSLIPRVHDDAEWAGLTTGARIEYGWWQSNVNIYGLLYNYYAVADNRKLCPAGWHVPSETEWITLQNNLGGVEYAGGKLKETGTDHWESPNLGALDQYGFTALPGGKRAANGTFNDLGWFCYWWTTQEASLSESWARFILNEYSNLFHGTYLKISGFSVRCIKD